MKIILALLSSLSLSACFGSGKPVQIPEPIIVIKEVNVPVVGACVPAGLGGIPLYLDTAADLLAAKSAAVRYQLLVAGRTQRINRLKEVEPVIAGCPRVK